MNNKNEKKNILPGRTKLIKFLVKVKEGEYSPIDKKTLSHVRMKEDFEYIESIENNYYYNIS